MKPAYTCLTIIGDLAVLASIGFCMLVLGVAPGRSGTLLTNQKAIAPPAGLQYADVCKKDKSMTAVQVQEQLDAVIGKDITNWKGWVYDVSKGDGDYTIEVGMEDPETAIFWARDVNLVGIAKEAAFQLSKKQAITFSGQISRIDNAFGTYCNPLVVENAKFIWR